jgi:hypothetical protein
MAVSTSPCARLVFCRSSWLVADALACRFVAMLPESTRSAFQNAMQQRFIDQVDGLSGRSVLAFISNHHVGPDIKIDLFMLAPAEPTQPGL